MILSVIIVNYNVKYFLEQCLYSVEKALSALDHGAQPSLPHAAPPLVDQSASASVARTEILVVDNHSPDGSVEYLRPKFPRVRFIANSDNPGFARANNQGLAEAAGKYILFLNPDTILPEDFFSTCLAFMEATPQAGALGVHMIDGSGRFLKESRRGFPSPRVAFCKLAGLTALFPRSKWLAEYYLGHLPDDRNHPAPVLSGACMLTRREALDRTGGFDERFFMYAEDIDLSYRIQQAGYINYYIADTTILHFKGESTRKDARYIRLFYKAMSQFRRKHFTGPLSALFNLLVDGAIWIRAGVAALLHGLLSRQSPRQTRPAPGAKSDSNTAPGPSVVSNLNAAPGPGSISNLNAPHASSAAPHRQTPGYRTRLTGDPASIAELTARPFPPEERVLVPDGQPANEIIFCEGADFSFSDSIAALRQMPRRMVCKIHAAGSASAVGSYSKRGMGEAIALDPDPGGVASGQEGL